MAPLGVTRRELLATMLGAPFALAACRARPRPLPPGEIAGASDELGHRLRDGEPRPVAPDAPVEIVEVAIVGAGAAGLAAAWWLRRHGVARVAVLELEPAAGGTARSGESAVTRFPWGAHYIAAPMRHQRALALLLDEMGVLEGTDAAGEPVVAEQFLCRAPEERVFYKGIWTEGLYLHAGESAEDVRQLVAFEEEVARWVAFRDGQGRRAFTLPVSACSDDAEVAALDRLTMAEWLDARGFTSWRLRWFVEYACRDDYGTLLDQTSAWAALFYFASRVRERGVESQGLITWPEGNGRLVAHLGRGADVRTGALVVDVHEDGTVVLADGRVLRARRVIFAAPQFIAGRVLRPWRRDPPAHLAAFRYGSWMVANLHLDDRPISRGFPLAWDNVLVESPSLGYVVATHQRGLDRGPTVFTYYYPGIDRRRLLELGRDDWAEVCLADLSRAHPDLRERCRRLDVMRWGHAMVAPAPGLAFGEARRMARLPVGAVHFACSDLSGMALFEEALDHGVRAAEEVAAGLGGPP